MTLALFLVAALATCCLAAVVGWTLLMRRRVVRDPEVFPCAVRILSGAVPGIRPGLRWRRFRARWVQNVLLLRNGPALGWAVPLPVRVAEDELETAGAAAEEHLGREAVQLRLRLDDDAVVVVAAARGDVERVAGPFFAMAVRRSSPLLGSPRPRRSE